MFFSFFFMYANSKYLVG